MCLIDDTRVGLVISIDVVEVNKIIVGNIGFTFVVMNAKSWCRKLCL